jgi:predicted permease
MGEMGILMQDLRYGARMLLKNPGFTAVVVLALALGIGANTAIFSVVNAVLLRPLPFGEPEQLMMVWGSSKNTGANHIVLSVPDVTDLRQQSQTLEYVAPYNGSGTTLSQGDETERVFGAVVPADLFPALRVKPLMGRVFTHDEDVPGGPAVVVISESLWRRSFGSDPAIVGKQIRLGGKAALVVGVMPESFRFPLKREERTEYWEPISASPSYVAAKDKRDTRSLNVLARLKPGVTMAQANEELAAISGRLEQQYPDSNAGLSLSLTPLHEDIVGQVRPALLVILGAVGFVLLIACANVANLLLARAASRQKEIAIRTALGAGRLRIVRQLLTESLLLALMGGGLGLLLATWGLDLLVAVSPSDLPLMGEVGLDTQVLGFTVAVSVLTGILFGLAPALQASRLDLNESLKEGGRGSTEGRRNRVRSLLVISEIALALVLLVGAGLLIRSFVTLLNTSPGFDAGAVLTADIPLSRSRYPDAEKQSAFVQQAIQATSHMPGVASVAAVNILPLSGNGRQSSFTIEGRPVPNGQEPDAEASTVSPEYFRTMGIPVIRGRTFNEGDKRDTPWVVVISETLARKVFPGEDPIGKRLGIDDGRPPFEIIGIVGDVRHEKLETESYPEYYRSFYQSPERQVNLVVRAAPSTDPATLQMAVRNAIKQLDREQIVWETKTMEQWRAESVARRRFNMMLLGLFASLALLLAAVGIYGVMSYTVTQRTHEIGIRLALGAQTRDVVRMVVRQGMTLALIGVGVGLLAAFGVTRVMSSLLYGVTSTDTLTFGAVSLLLVVLALLACLIPARRATRVDPMTALRYE